MTAENEAGFIRWYAGPRSRLSGSRPWLLLEAIRLVYAAQDGFHMEAEELGRFAGGRTQKRAA
jgi:hypothetical protein